MSSRGNSTPRLTDWLTDRQSQCDFDFGRLQFSWVKWRKVAGWWVRIQLKVSLWREDQEVDVKWPPTWDPIGWVVSWEDLYTWVCKKEILYVISGVCNSMRLLIVPMLKSVVRERLMETNRLRTLVRVCQWLVKCCCESYISVINKSKIKSETAFKWPLFVTVCTYSSF
jgi:hypothetical protein